MSTGEVEPVRRARAFFEAVVEGDTHGVANFLARGADPNGKGPDGRTLLMVACASARVEVALLLLEHGADARTRDEAGNTPLLALFEGLARAQHSRDLEAMRSQARRDIEELRAFALLAAANRDSKPRVELPRTFRALLEALVEAGVPIDAVDELGRTTLAIAVADGYPPWVIAALLRSGADPRIADDDGLTPLCLAAEDSPEVRAMLERACDGSAFIVHRDNSRR